MDFDKKNMTLDEAIEIIKEIEPKYERTNSGTAESLILQAVHCTDMVPVIRCSHCIYHNQHDSCTHPKQCRHGENGNMICVISAPPDHFCAYGQRRE